MFILKKVVLKNWKSHEHSVIDFSEGVNLLIGIMGSGKSSILEAISYSLFGTFPDIDRRKIKISDVIRNNFESASLTLIFQWNNDEWKVIRTITPKKTDATLYKNNSLIEKGQSNVTKYLEELLNIDYSLFYRSIYSEQNRINDILDLPPSKRKESFDKVLGLDKFETARKNLNYVINQYQSELKGLLSSFDRNEKNELLEQKKHIENSINEKTNILLSEKNKLFDKNKELSSLEKSIALEKQELFKLEKKFNYLLSLKGKINSAEQDLKDFDEKELSNIENEIKTINLDSLFSKRDLIKKELSSLRTSYNNIYSKLNLTVSKRKRLEDLVSKLSNRSSSSLKQDLDNKKRLINELVSKRATYKERLKQIDSLLEHISSSSSSCPICKRPLSSDHKKELVEQFSNEKKLILKELNSISIPDLSSIEKEYIYVKRLEQEISEIKKELLDPKDLENQLDLLKDNISKKEKELNSINELIAKDNARLSKLLEKKKSLLLLINKKQQLSKWKEEFLEFDNVASLKKTKEEIILDLEKQRSSISSVVLSLNSHIKELNEDILSLKKTLLSIDNNLSKLESIEKRSNALSTLISNLNKYLISLKRTQTELRNNLISAINSSLTEVWKMIYPYGDFKEIRLIANDKGYIFEVRKEKWESISKMSGGEKTALALAIRIVLANILTPHLNILFLDEPTHNLDKQSISVLSDLIQNNLSDFVKQSIIITHDENFIGENFSKTYLLKRNKNKDSPTEVSLI